MKYASDSLALITDGRRAGQALDETAPGSSCSLSRVAVRLFVAIVTAAGIAIRADEGEAGRRPPSEVSGSVVAVERFLQASELMSTDVGLREAMCKALWERERDDRTAWIGVDGTRLFAISVRKLPVAPPPEQTGPAMMRVATLFAANELLKTEKSLGFFSALGLDDPQAAREALDAAAANQKTEGLLRRMQHEEGVVDGMAVAYAVAESADILALARDGVVADRVVREYLKIMEKRVAALMAAEKWPEALATCNVLQEKHLSTAELLLNSAQCLREMGRQEEALASLTWTLPLLRAHGSSLATERLGDLAMACGDRDLAREAYKTASEQMLDSTTGE